MENNLHSLPAHPNDAATLSDLAVQSKSHWGYDQSLLEQWRPDLSIDATYISTHTVRKLLLHDKLVGFFAIKNEPDLLLDHLWLLPHAIGHGYGTQAWQFILTECQHLNIKSFTLTSDPNAEGFYLHMGAQRVGDEESIPQNRMLPKLRFHVPPPA